MANAVKKYKVISFKAINTSVIEHQLNVIQDQLGSGWDLVCACPSGPQKQDVVVTTWKAV